MLNDAERRMLAEIESSLRAEDPRFVQRFSSRRRRPRQRGAVWMALIAAVTVALVALVAGSALGFVVGLVAAVATVGLYASHREDRQP
jgi:L-alanine-DL-glutamate epimerase-like enolase superfamily enzyme